LSLFDENKDYPFIKLDKIEKFDFAPFVPDTVWNTLEAIGAQRKLKDVDGDVDLFGL
jgi:hypothetical protein